MLGVNCRGVGLLRQYSRSSGVNSFGKQTSLRPKIEEDHCASCQGDDFEHRNFLIVDWEYDWFFEYEMLEKEKSNRIIHIFLRKYLKSDARILKKRFYRRNVRFSLYWRTLQRTNKKESADEWVYFWESHIDFCLVIVIIVQTVLALCSLSLTSQSWSINYLEKTLLNRSSC